MRTLGRSALAAILVLGGAAPLAAQGVSTYEACYVPGVGAIYLVNQTGLPSSCLGESHVAFTWTTGEVADGAVTEAKLAFDPATQAELDAFVAALVASGVVNSGGNPVDWTQLKNVPAGFADGVDESGGTPSDLVCAGCVDPTDLADASVTGTKIATGAVDATHLGFDPATQTELDAHAASADHDGRYSTEAELSDAGTINDDANPVDWTKLKGVPVDFADGVDDTGGVTDHSALTGLASDDHPQYLLGDGARNVTDGFAVTGTTGTGSIPAAGPGTRLMWYPGRAAFRAGEVGGPQWDDASVGRHSAALGWSTIASGAFSAALGGSTTASGDGATAMGSATSASGDYATVMGSSNQARGIASVAMNWGTIASGDRATAMGGVTTAQAYASLAIGRYNVVAGNQSSWIGPDPLFVAGNGTSAGSRSNALTLYKDGNLTIAGTLTENSDIRLKEDVEPLGSVLRDVLALTPIRYRFGEGTGHPTAAQIGLSAQDVERAFPELVSQDSEGYLSVAYTNLAAVLVRALQEQQVEIDALRAEVAALRAARLEGVRER